MGKSKTTTKEFGAAQIVQQSGVRSGQPVVAGTRLTVYDILECFASGMTEAQIIQDYPKLTPESIRAALAYAAERERRLAPGEAS